MVSTRASSSASTPRRRRASTTGKSPDRDLRSPSPSARERSPPPAKKTSSKTTSPEPITQTIPTPIFVFLQLAQALALGFHVFYLLADMKSETNWRVTYHYFTFWSMTLQCVFLAYTLVPQWITWAIQRILFLTLGTVLNVVPIIMVIVVVWDNDALCPDGPHPADPKDSPGLRCDASIIEHLFPVILMLTWVIVHQSEIAPSIRAYAKSLPDRAARIRYALYLMYAPLLFLGAYLILFDADQVYRVTIPGYVTLISSFIIDTLALGIPVYLILQPNQDTSLFGAWPI